MTKPPKSREKVAIWVSWTNIAANTVLAAFKLFAGIVAGSQAMISDGVHTLSDMFSTFFVIAGIRLGAKKSDRDHQYGHERFESVAAILLSIVLAATGVFIGWAGIQRIIAGPSDLAPPGVLALIAAVVSILFKEGMYWRTRYYAKRLNSSALMADAWHNRSDSLSSIGSFAGILGARLGAPVLDPVASLVICVFILKAALDVFKDAVGKMTDQAIDEKTAAEIRSLAEAQPGVVHLDRLQTRVFGDRVYVDIEIAIDGDLSLRLAHDIAQGVHDAVEARFPAIKHCMVHMNPSDEKGEKNGLQLEEKLDKIDKSKRRGGKNMTFVLLGQDHKDPGALERRMAARPAHLEGVQILADEGKLKFGGALLNDEGTMVGSMMVLDYPSEEALREEFLSKEPYMVQGVWETIEIRPIRVSDKFNK